MLIDIHAHLQDESNECNKSKEWNEKQIYYVKKAGITQIWASVLGSWGADSPVYLPSLKDMIRGNRAIFTIQQKHPGFIKGYCYINPVFGSKSLDELRYCIEDLGMIGMKLGASCNAASPVLYPFIEKCIDYDVPILHHVYQRKLGDIPGQEASDAEDIASLAAKFPEAKLILAHIGGGGDWEFTLKAVKPFSNIYVDISGSGCDDGMLQRAYTELGALRLLFGTDLNLCSALAKLEGLNIPRKEKELIGYKNALALLKNNDNLR